jgi:hypothetical protein
MSTRQHARNAVIVVRNLETLGVTTLLAGTLVRLPDLSKDISDDGVTPW